MSGFSGGLWGEIVSSRSSLGGAWAASLGGEGLDGATVGFGPADARPLVLRAVAGAVQGALSRLQREDGLPTFLAEAVQAQVGATADTWQDAQGTQAEAGTVAANEACSQVLQAFGNELADAIVQSVRQQLQAQGSGSDADGTARAGSGSWMLAIARAMGEVLGNKASRMVELSQQIQDLSERSRLAAGDGTQPLDDAGRAQQLLDAAESQRLNTEFQATGQEFNLLQTTFSTAMKTLGEGMASVARKQ
jgi:hypothetical protein